MHSFKGKKIIAQSSVALREQAHAQYNLNVSYTLSLPVVAKEKIQEKYQVSFFSKSCKTNSILRK